MYGTDVIDPMTPFQDPYSDVSLFLTKKIRQHGTSSEGTSSWSHQLEEELLQKITPEFVKRFPDHRLGPATVKKTWERVYHLVDLLKQEQETVTSNGTLNLHFLIRENLKTVFMQSKKGSFHPFLLSQQLALKIGETIATFEGIKPDIKHLTEIIWCSLSHILPPPAHMKPLDLKDRLITKWMVDILRRESSITFADLSKKLQSKVHFYQALHEGLTSHVDSLKIEWAKILLQQTSLYQKSSSKELIELRKWASRFSIENLQELKTEALLTQPKYLLTDLEILFWSQLRTKNQGLMHSDSLIELSEEAKTDLIYHPTKPWTNIISHAAYLMQKASDVTKSCSQKEWDKRIEYWASQGELALRHLQLPESPLHHFVIGMHAKNRSFKDPTTTTQLREQYLYRYPSPLLEPSFVHQHAELMRKYGWYHYASSPTDSTLDRFTQFNDSQGDLKTRMENQFPTLPLPLAARKHRYKPIKMNGTESH